MWDQLKRQNKKYISMKYILMKRNEDRSTVQGYVKFMVGLIIPCNQIELTL